MLGIRSFLGFLKTRLAPDGWRFSSYSGAVRADCCRGLDRRAAYQVSWRGQELVDLTRSFGRPAVLSAPLKRTNVDGPVGRSCTFRRLIGRVGAAGDFFRALQFPRVCETDHFERPNVSPWHILMGPLSRESALGRGDVRRLTHATGRPSCRIGGRFFGPPHPLGR